MDVKTAGTLSSTTTVATKVASVEKDRVVHNLPDHTAKEPRVIIFNRQLPGSGDKEVLRAGLKTVYGDRNTDGTAKSGNIIVETSIRIPQDQELSLASGCLAMHFAVLRDPLIMDDVLESGLIPLE
jgi:hypothetical protein